jgi:hypothetical protein
MSDQHSTAGQPTSQCAVAESSAPAKRRTSSRFKVAVVVAAIGVTMLLVYGLDVLAPVLRAGKDAVSGKQLGPLFARAPVDQLFSPDRVLTAVGKSPVDPSKVLFPVFEKSIDPEGEKKPKSCPTGPMTTAAAIAQAPAGEDGDYVASPAGETKEDSASGTFPAIEARGPGPKSDVEPKSATAAGESGKSDGTEHKNEGTPSEATRKDQTRTKVEGSGKADRTPQRTPPSGTLAATSPGDSQPRSESAPSDPRPDQFQLPGSLVVKINNYSGTTPKWSLMVIMDDSASMAKRLRLWNPNRINAASKFTGKLTEALTPGSKVAVRDFLCGKGDHAASRKESCLSHMLYEWSEAPFKSLQEKLGQANAGGKTNPCAAAAYSLRKDFGGLSGHSPRLLVITDGASKCGFSEVLKAIDEQGLRDKARVDVLVLGANKKRQAGYVELAKRTGGQLLRADGPQEVDNSLAKYGKLLKTPVMERVEVRGQKAVLTTSPDEEITLSPGAYTVVLPAVAGISPSKRTVEDVKIKSGEATLLQVKVKKGKPVVKIGKK